MLADASSRGAMPEKEASPGRVYEQIRAEVLSCALAPGSQIFEQALAQRLGVSKSPVREALLRLQEQSLVEVQPRRGYRVRPISITEAQEMYEMRLLYERACVSRVIDHADDSQIDLLKSVLHVAGEFDLRQWIEMNRNFHCMLAAICGNSRLAKATIELIQQFERYTYVSIGRLAKPLNMERFEREHAAIVDAIKRRNKREALTIIREHVEASRRRTLEVLASAVVVP